jgi:hypothetical protein
MALSHPCAFGERLVIVVLLAMAGVAAQRRCFAQEQTAASGAAADSKALAKKLSNPLVSLFGFPVQGNYDPTLVPPMTATGARSASSP